MLTTREMVNAIWLALGAVWLLTALRSKPVLRRTDTISRIWEIIIMASGAALLFSQGPQLAGLPEHALPGHAVLASLGVALAAVMNARSLPAQPMLVAAGVTLTAAGAALALVARLYLGKNWSAAATIKQDHEIIRSGPYGWVRHPIYTGMLLAAIGTAMAFGETRDLLALPLVIVGFWMKARSEERLLMSNFGDRYAAYRREVRGAIIPHVL
jgi:protein-S-isoprenylcysteine O-methyltransferase Ste14